VLTVLEVRMDGMRVGFIGLGAMGGGMARNLVKAGFAVTALDLDADKVKELVAAGAGGARDVRELVERCDYVLTSVSDSDALVKLAEGALIPEARKGQVFIDLTTVRVSEARRLSEMFAARGAVMLDAPVSGGSGGATAGTLWIFVGGNREAYDAAGSIFAAIGDHVTYCGASGLGQIVKGVNQMAMGLGEAAFMESVAFGVMLGADPAVIRDAVGGDEGWRKAVSRAAQRVIDNTAKGVGIKHDQLPYFLDEAERAGFELPISRALHIFCEPGERTVKEANRWSPSFWTELTKKQR
jgi:3-hydroxyisobutyrate dehydrogenase-like beta-hydroxyacid dehydrogenase